MRRSSVLHDVTHDQLLSALGNLLEDGWVVRQAFPTLQYVQGPVQTVTSIATQRWTIFLEKEFPDREPPAEPRPGYPPH